jgi:hypothetical protein
MREAPIQGIHPFIVAVARVFCLTRFGIAVMA